MAVLIIGGDSRVSRELIPVLTGKGEKVYATTRRTDRISVAGEISLFLDLSNVEGFHIPDDVDSMVIIGGVVDYGECTNSYDYAYQVNCVNIPQLARAMLGQGGYVCFISTNTVFKSEAGLPSEDDKRSPGFPYAELKACAEEKLEQVVVGLDCQERFCILRLTKNVGLDTPPFGDWIAAFAREEKITPFKDLFFAPIRFADSAHAIEVVLEKRQGGIFHLSGERDIDYAEFAVELCRYLGLRDSLVAGVRSVDMGVSLVYNHPITALAMNSTCEHLGLEPVPLTKIYELLGRLLEDHHACFDKGHS